MSKEILDGKISVSELRSICEILEKEYGPNGTVVIQIRNESGEFVSGGFVYAHNYDSDGNLYLTNNPPRLSSYTN